MKILIIKASSLGDILHTFPVLEYLRSLFPLGQIDWVVEAAATMAIDRAKAAKPGQTNLTWGTFVGAGVNNDMAALTGLAGKKPAAKKTTKTK